MTRIDEAARWIGADPQDVFAALVDPLALERWLPPRGMTGRIAHFDGRVGGGYRMELAYTDPANAPGKTGDGTDLLQARYVEFVPDERTVMEIEFESDDPAFAGTMRMTWQVDPAERGCIVTFTAEDVPPGIDPVDHEAGMMSSLRNLEAYLTAPSEG